jgi:thiosulfate/3-mercaptopyruvate sulfurtransferase
VRSLVRSLCLLACAAGIAGAQKAGDPRDALLVSTAWLGQHLNDPALVLLHLGPDDAYAKAHVPGTYNVQMEDFAVDDHTANGQMLELLPAETLRAKLGAFGITDRSRVVVIAAGGFTPWATRLILTLDYAGLGDRTALLDGGMPAWTKEGRPVTAVVPDKRTSTLGPLRTKAMIVDASYVKGHLGKPGISVVDGRAPAFYEGVSQGSGHAGAHRAGHVAGAKSVPFTAPYADDGHVRSTAELRELFAKAGVAPGDTIIGYCHIGLQATAMLFAARLLGHPVMLYDGSFDDWSRHPAAEYPVETTSTRGK